MRLLALLASTLLLAGCLVNSPGDGSTDGATADPHQDGDEGDSPSALVRTVPFQGVAAGVGACDNLLVPLAQQADPLPVARNATTVRLEIAYTATAPGSLNELSVDVHRDEAVVGGANHIAGQRGPSPIVIDIQDGDWGDAEALQIVVYNCDAPAEQPFDGRASFFAGPIPDGYTALP